MLLLCLGKSKIICVDKYFFFCHSNVSIVFCCMVNVMLLSLCVKFMIMTLFDVSSIRAGRYFTR